MKMFEEIKDFRKEYVYEQYTRIVEDFKEYDKITKTKMLEAIYKVYEDSYNIIDICTVFWNRGRSYWYSGKPNCFLDRQKHNCISRMLAFRNSKLFKILDEKFILYYHSSGDYRNCYGFI